MATDRSNPRVNIYVDGFNLFYGSLRNTPYRWLDLSALFARKFPGANIQRIRYFSARVVGTPADPDGPLRQDMYLRALRTIPTFSEMFGHFLTKPTQKQLVNPVYGPNPRIPNPSNGLVWVWKTEEKGSDVNLATSILLDACAGDFDKAWVVSNDSDLAWPIQRIRQRFRLQVGVLKPERPAGYPSTPRPDSIQLKKAARWFRRIEEADLIASQFPPTLTDATGTITKPSTW